MITAKFGGTAITPRNLIHLKEILTPKHGCIVVSAVGKEYQNDTKTTDLLVAYHQSKSDEVWQQISDKYRSLVEVNAIDIDVEQLLSDARGRADTNDLQYCMSLGEELSARVVSAFLDATYIEAENTVRFCDNELNEQTTYDNIKNAFCGVNFAVVGGFYGGSSRGRRTFSRGGSDVSGAIFAAALGSTLYENWTDVNGVCVANPTKVHGVMTVPALSYSEMRLLSLAGAEVLHPDAVTPVEKLGIPIKIGNFFSPHGASTLVSYCPSRNKLLSIAERKQGGKVVTTLLHSYPLCEISRYLAIFLKRYTQCIGIFGVSRDVCNLKVYNIEMDDNTVRLVTDTSILNSLYKCFVI